MMVANELEEKKKEGDGPPDIIMQHETEECAPSKERSKGVSSSYGDSQAREEEQHDSTYQIGEEEEDYGELDEEATSSIKASEEEAEEPTPSEEEMTSEQLEELE